MFKNVLIISSSARREGNSDLLCEQFRLGALEAGHRVEKVRLAELEIGFCRGCGACDVSHRCVQQDDMAALLDKLLGADVIVLATPVYFYSLCARMKAMLDRCVPRYEELSHKEFYVILAAAEESREEMQRTVECFRGFFDCLEDAREMGVIYGTGAWHAGEVRSLPVMREAFEAGKSC